MYKVVEHDFNAKKRLKGDIKQLNVDKTKLKECFVTKFNRLNNEITRLNADNKLLSNGLTNAENTEQEIGLV